MNAIDKIFRWSGTYQDILTTKSFHVLCEKRLEYLNNDEWNKFRNNAEERFKENFTTKIQETYDSKRLISIFKRKHILGWMFVLMGVLLATVGAIVVYLYPHTLPF